MRLALRVGAILMKSPEQGARTSVYAASSPDLAHVTGTGPQGAVTLEDVFGRPAGEQNVWLGRGVSLAWGLFAVAAGIACAHSGAAILELINRIGSLFYGPLAGVFALGVAAPAVAGRHAVAALALGLGGNLALALGAPWLSWLWWNPAGFLATFAAGSLLALRLPRLPRPSASRREALLLGGAFVVMLALLAALGGPP